MPGKSKNSGSWSEVYDGSGISTSRTLNSGEYRYKARGCNAAGCGPWSAIKTVHVENAGGCSPTPPFICNDPQSQPEDPPEEW